MLRTRLWMGAVLIALVVGVLRFDPAPVFPFLLLLAVLLAAVGSLEMELLIGTAHGLPRGLLPLAVLPVLLANWPARLWPETFGPDPWGLVAGVFAAVVMIAFLVEMARFHPVPLSPSPPTPLPREGGEGSQSPSPPAGERGWGEGGNVVVRIALVTWTVAYLALLPSFLVQFRWLDGDARAALALAIFVPKSCDIGAYFTGRLLGRHPMAPVLSPKKTWEGLAGGLLLSAAVAVAINRLLPVVRGGDLAAAGFGLVVGTAGALGDLAESLVKRDCRRKDASQVVPGFGGVLDVVDAILFAAPVAYGWLRFG